MAEPDAAAWHRLLDDLDEQLRQAGRLMDSVGDSGGLRDIADIRRPHEPLGVMPAEVVDRARRILSEYDIAFGRMQGVRRQVGEHLSLLQSAREERLPRPVYLDRVS